MSNIACEWCARSSVLLADMTAATPTTIENALLMSPRLSFQAARRASGGAQYNWNIS
jgi:hypothetical protein